MNHCKFSETPTAAGNLHGREAGSTQMAVGAAFLAAEPGGTETNVLLEPVCSASGRRLSSRFHSHHQRFSQVNQEDIKVEGMVIPSAGKDRLSAIGNA